ncbi:MAG: hypothetical protein DRQ37_00530 [Gammaproteobacteria bacterium]|nr:MAG: hypothetical protein DRQ37_00530 [Gammaproteobacteria bacterium]
MKYKLPGGRPSLLTKILLAGMLFLTFAGTSSADPRITVAGGYQIHHGAVPSEFLDAALARRLGLRRSRGGMMFTVSVVRLTPPGGSVRATIDLRARNQRGGKKPINLQEIHEGGAVSYLGELRVANGETVIFDMDITPAGEARALKVRYQQAFFVD